MTAPVTAGAVFVRAPVLLRVTARGKGRVTSAPTGISCPGVCTHSFGAGKKVRLKPKPTHGWRFAAWGGACSGTRACVVATDKARLVRARFVRR